MKPHRNVWHIIGRGKAGWHATGIENNLRVLSSGGMLLPYTFNATTPCDGYAREAIEGALVYDADEAPYDEFARLIIAGPMFEPKLNDWEYKFGILDHTVHSLPTTQRACTLESLKALNIRSLSSIGAGIYERLLRNVPNVKFGRIKNGEVVWENSKIEA